ncbi:MAG TPA: ribonuclease HI family protein [Candidatus Fraserbacteria bacterium]|nr:ribonuclease HI family protein [Candidatus Fraserbacteria bacterium]
MDKLLINFDGASHGNPGEAAVGIVLTDGQANVVEEISRPIGRTTNNVAEYQALIEAARAVLPYRPERAIFFTDSQLLANQINGLYRLRRPHLAKLNRAARELLDRLPRWQVRYVERSANWRAHRLAQQALQSHNEQLSASGELKGSSELLERLSRQAARLSESDQRKLLGYAARLLEESEES